MRPEVGDAVPACPLAGEDARPARSADRGRDKGVREPHAALCHRIHIRRLDNRIARTAHRVGSLVVGQQENNVRLFFRFGSPDESTLTTGQR